jgi:hypothetical protein
MRLPEKKKKKKKNNWGLAHHHQELTLLIMYRVDEVRWRKLSDYNPTKFKDKLEI